jgi:hypothetical protein
MRVIASRRVEGIMPKYWFKAEIRFMCPACKRESIEMIFASDEKHDPGAVAIKIKERVHPLPCQHCKAICPGNTQIYLGMNDLTPEELSKINFGGNPSGRVM